MHNIRLLLLFICLCVLNQASTAAPSYLTSDEAQWLKSQTKITVAYDGHFPPYSFLGTNGRIQGLAVDVFKKLEQQLNIPFIPKVYEKWSELYSDAQSNKVDLVATMVKRPQRLAHFSFTEPYIHKSLVVVTSHDSAISKRTHLSGKTIALVKGYQSTQRILLQHPDIIPLYTDTMLEALNAVVVNKADAAISFVGGVHFLRKKYQLSHLKYAFIYDENHSGERIAIRGDSPILASIMRKSLQAIPGIEIQALRQKWLPQENPIQPIRLTEKEQQWIQKNPIIRLGIDQEFAPFEFYKNNEYMGMTADYIELLNRRLGLNMQVQSVHAWDEVIQRVKRNEIDVLPVIAKSQDRETYLNFTQPYLFFHRVIISRIELPFITGLDDIESLSIGVQKDSSHHEYLKDHSNIKPIVFDSLNELLLAVSDGTVDIMVGNVASASYWITENNLGNLKIAAPVATDLQELHFAVRKDWPELVDILQKGIDSIHMDEHYKIKRRWLDINYDPISDYRTILKLFFFSFVLVLLILIWNYQLNKKVKNKTDQVVYYAKYDPLTNLPNRYLIQDSIEHLINKKSKKQKSFCVISIDLIDFKKVNDLYGHHIGDKVLASVSKSLLKGLNDDIQVGRLGGDQFLIVIPGVSIETEVHRHAQYYLSLLSDEIEVDDLKLAVPASLGVAIYPESGSTAGELIRSADVALNHSKHNIKSNIVFHTQALTQDVSRQFDLQNKLRKALENNELSVHYQPKIFSNTKKVYGFEALLRWDNKEIGSITPFEFIPIAESSGAIEPIGLYVLNTALKQLKIWQEHYDPTLKMAINLSPRQCQSSKFYHDLLLAVHSSGVAYDSIELEITEGFLLQESDDIKNLIYKISDTGICLALDDFGTGYSSLSYLRRFKFNTLKVDKEFVCDMVDNESDYQLVEAAIALAHALKLTVVAEGVETQAQSDLLSDMGCEILQGWHYGKAMSAEKADAYLKAAQE